MSPVSWPLHDGRPAIEFAVSTTAGDEMIRRLVADTGAGAQAAPFELILHQDDCRQCGGILVFQVQLGGAYSGMFPVSMVDVRISALNFDEPVPVVGVTDLPPNFDGLAGFKFLNHFDYGNRGDPGGFTLDAPLP